MRIKRFNVGCKLEDGGKLIFSVSGGGMIDEIAAIYDRGVSIRIITDLPNRAALKEAGIAPGCAVTCVDAGLFRLGSVPDGLLTVDATGNELGVSVVQDEDDLAGSVSAARRAEMRSHGVLAGRRRPIFTNAIAGERNYRGVRAI